MSILRALPEEGLPEIQRVATTTAVVLPGSSLQRSRNWWKNGLEVGGMAD